LKVGSSDVGSELAVSHTRSLAGSDRLYSALFERLCIARAHDLSEFLETLKLLHSCGALVSARVGSVSCSGGDALLMADQGEASGLTFPPFGPAVTEGLRRTLGSHVALHNPLDYQTYIWGNEEALSACFSSVLQAEIDVCVLILDFPDAANAVSTEWDQVARAFITATADWAGAAVVVSTLAELMPAEVAERLFAAGIAPLQGIRDAARAIASAARMANSKARALASPSLRAPSPLPAGPAILLDEATAKSRLGASGLAIPVGRCVNDAESTVEAASELGYPVALKALSEGLAHKTEQGALRLNLHNEDELREAHRELSNRYDRFLIETMVTGGVAELIVGVTQDPQFGLALTIGAGGILVELLADSVTLLLPTSHEEIEHALRGLRAFPLLNGYRGRPKACLAAIVDAVGQIADFALAHAGRLIELDVNPLIVTPQSAVAVDAVIRMIGDEPSLPASGASRAERSGK
jgi:acetyl-CoA synthetase